MRGGPAPERYDQGIAPFPLEEGYGNALYLHVPFCVVKCGYCDFHSVADSDPQTMREIVGAILEEIRSLGFRPRPRTIFMGGGTPTHLPERLLEELCQGILDLCDLTHLKEWTCEANPESCTPSKLQVLKDAGVDRMSLGIQSFHPSILRFLDRPHGLEESRKALELCRETGFPHLNLDLIFGIPGEDRETWAEDLRTALGFHPDHLSCYQLSFEKGTPLHKALHEERIPAPEEEVCVSQLLSTREYLRDNDYIPYEISNFAKRGAWCLHNVNYWRAGNYLGIGPGASKHRDGWRATNHKALPLYLSSIRESGCPEAQAEFLSERTRCGEALWLGLRMDQGVSLKELEARFGIPILLTYGQLIQEGREAGHLLLEEDTLRLSEEAIPVADSWLMRFLSPSQARVPRGT